MGSGIGKRALALATAALLSNGAAGAQQFGSPAMPFNGLFTGRTPAAGDRSVLRVQVQYQLQVPLDRDAPLDRQKSAIEAGHAALYDLAKRECEALRPSFDGDCRVVGLNVGNAAPGFGPGGVLSMNASATIEIAPPPPAPKPQ